MNKPEDEILMMDIQKKLRNSDQESEQGSSDRRSSMNIQRLYELLDEKNAAIDELKQKLTNQQVQLAYYLRKNFENSSVTSFSNECTPDLADENLQLSMAMFKFVRETGRRSRLSILKDRLEQYDRRVQEVLQQHEQLVEERMGVEHGWLKECEERMENDEEFSQELEEEDEFDNMSYKERVMHVAHMDLCSALIFNILKVRKELKQFRICAERITELEAERNALVEQVYSLTSEERYNAVCATVSEDQQNDEEQQNSESEEQQETTNNTDPSTSSDSKETEDNKSHAENALSLQNIYCPQQKASDDLKKMLSSIQIETIKVMLLSKRQRKKFSSELHAIRRENKMLKKRLRSMEELTTNESMLELQEKCIRIGQDIQELHRWLETDSQEKDKEIQRMIEERRMKNVEEIRLKEELTQLRATISVLRAERDSLQRRLDANEKMSQNLKLYELKNKEIMEMNDIILMQDKQIKDLLTILSKINKEKLHANGNGGKKGNGCSRDDNNLAARNRSPKVDLKVKHSRAIRSKSKRATRNNLNQSHTSKASSQLSVVNISSTHQGKVNLRTERNENETGDENSESGGSVQIVDIQNEIHAEENIDEGLSMTMTESQEEMNVGHEIDEIKSYHESEYLMDQTLNTSSAQTANNIIPVRMGSESFLSRASLLTEIDERIGYLISNSQATVASEMKDDAIDPSIECERSNSKIKVGGDAAHRDGDCSFRNNSRCRYITSQMNNTATTSLRVEACNENGKSESMQAVLECTSPHEGFLEMENSSKLRLRLECTSPSRCNHTDNFHSKKCSHSCLSCSQRNIVGDFIRTSNITREARMQLSNHLEKMKSELEKCEPATRYESASETAPESSWN